MIFPEDPEDCTLCKKRMLKQATGILPKTWRMRLKLRKGVYISTYECECKHRLTVFRDLPRRWKRG